MTIRSTEQNEKPVAIRTYKYMYETHIVMVTRVTSITGIPDKLTIIFSISFMGLSK